LIEFFIIISTINIEENNIKNKCMNSKINKILQEIEKKKKELIKEYYEIKEKYGFSIKS